MKVRDISGSSAGKMGGRIKEGKIDKPGVEQASFKESLAKSYEDDLEERMSRLLQDIEEQGRKLASSLNLKDLLLFKKKIREFLEEAVSGMFKFSKRSVIDRKGRHRIYALVKRINQEMEELTQEMMKGQKDRLGILQKIDSIRGLLIDLYT